MLDTAYLHLRYAPCVHVVTVVSGWDGFYALCEGCLFQSGPFTDRFEAQLDVLWHEQVTTPWQVQGQ